MDSELGESLFKFLLVCFAIVSVFGAPVFLLMHNEYQKASLWCLFSVILILILNFDKIEILKLWGLEAKLREKIHEADVTLEKLKDIAGSISRASLAEVIPGGFQSGMSLEERLNQYDRIIKTLGSIGLTKEEIDIVKTEWKVGIGRHYKNKIYRSMKKIVEKNHKSVDYENLQEIIWDTGSTPNSILEYANTKQWDLDERTLNLIKSYEHFLDQGEIDNRELFLQEID